MPAGGPKRRQRGLIAAAALLAFGLPAGSAAHAATFTVDTTADDANANPGDGQCLTVNGDCSLRAAIAEASASPGVDRVNLPPGIYEINTIPWFHGQLTVDGDALVAGTGTASATIIRQGDSGRVIDVAPSADLELRDVTVANGTLAAPGAGIRNRGSLTLRRTIVRGNQTIAADGGGIYADGDLTRVFASVIGTPTRPNIAGGAGPGNLGGLGGGIAVADGELVVRGSLIEANEANQQRGTGTGFNGGGIQISHTGDPVRIVETTVRGNSANHRDGGGIHYSDAGAGGSLLVLRSTISGNEAATGAGGILANGRRVRIVNSTVSGNEAPDAMMIWGNPGGHADGHPAELLGSTIAHNDVDFEAVTAMDGTLAIRGTLLDNPGSPNCQESGGEIVSNGFNIDSGSSCGFAPAESGLFPMIGPLADNGGPTETHALLTGSPAIDQGSSAGLATDQRGIPRPSVFLGISNTPGGDGADIGAFERASNRFRLAKLIRNPNRGTARQRVRVPGAGRLILHVSKQVRRTARATSGPGLAALVVRPRGAARRQLESTGRARVRLRITFNPHGGPARTSATRIVLRKRPGG